MADQLPPPPPQGVLAGWNKVDPDLPPAPAAFETDVMQFYNNDFQQKLETLGLIVDKNMKHNYLIAKELAKHYMMLGHYSEMELWSRMAVWLYSEAITTLENINIMWTGDNSTIKLLLEQETEHLDDVEYKKVRQLSFQALVVLISNELGHDEEFRQKFLQKLWEARTQNSNDYENQYVLKTCYLAPPKNDKQTALLLPHDFASVLFGGNEHESLNKKKERVLKWLTQTKNNEYTLYSPSDSTIQHLNLPTSSM